MKNSKLFLGWLLLSLICILRITWGKSTISPQTIQWIAQRHDHFWSKLMLNSGQKESLYTIEASSQIPELISHFSINGTWIFDQNTAIDLFTFATNIDAWKKKDSFSVTGMIERFITQDKKAVKIHDVQREYKKFEELRELLNNLVTYTKWQRIWLEKQKGAYFLTHSMQINEWASMTRSFIVPFLLWDKQQEIISTQQKKWLIDALVWVTKKTSLFDFGQITESEIDGLFYEEFFDPKNASLTIQWLTHPSWSSLFAMQITPTSGSVTLTDQQHGVAISREWNRLTNYISWSITLEQTNEKVSFVGTIHKSSGSTKEQYDYQGELIIRLQWGPVFNKYDSLYYSFDWSHIYTQNNENIQDFVQDTLPFHKIIEQFQL